MPSSLLIHGWTPNGPQCFKGHCSQTDHSESCSSAFNTSFPVCRDFREAARSRPENLPRHERPCLAENLSNEDENKVSKGTSNQDNADYVVSKMLLCRYLTVDNIIHLNITKQTVLYFIYSILTGFYSFLLWPIHSNVKCCSALYW